MFLAVHGGAGERRPSKNALRVLAGSISRGYEILCSCGNALDAVVMAIRVLEDSGDFNAGAGGNLQFDGVRRLDASLMEGNYLKAGSVAGLEGIRNAVEAARLLMDLPHVMMTNIGAKKIAQSVRLEPLGEPDEGSLIRLEKLKQRKKSMSDAYKKYFSTVGAVALDKKGSVAAGASTGGVAAMLPGRVGDTPVIGGGIYAEDGLGAVSCTGIGESIIRLSLAKEICMNLERMNPSRSAKASLNRIRGIGGEAGVLVINSQGHFTIMHTTKYMASGYASKKGIVIREGFGRLQE